MSEAKRPAILSVTTEYPTRDEPVKGLFIRSRLQALGEFADLRIILPVPVLDYAHPRGKWFAAFSLPRARIDGRAEVRHVRWLYPPRAGFVTALCLFLQLLRPVRRARRERPFDLIDAHFGHPEGVAAALLGAAFNCPFVVTLRGNEMVHAGRRLRRAWLAWAVRRAYRVITVSEDLRRFAISLGAAAGAVITIPNGVDTAIFSRRDKLECRREHGIPPDARVVLSAGDLAEVKGHHRIVRAIRGLRGAGIPAELLIAGGVGRSGHFAPAIQDEIAACGLTGRVRFLGEVRQQALAELMCAADVFCLASSREGWPNVVNEALSCGTPVVATRVGAVPDLIPAESYGLVVPPGNVEALEAALRAALLRSWDHAAIARWGQARSWSDVALEVLAAVGRPHCAATPPDCGGAAGPHLEKIANA